MSASTRRHERRLPAAPLFLIHVDAGADGLVDLHDVARVCSVEKSQTGASPHSRDLEATLPVQCPVYGQNSELTAAEEGRAFSHRKSFCRRPHLDARLSARPREDRPPQNVPDFNLTGAGGYATQKRKSEHSKASSIDNT